MNAKSFQRPAASLVMFLILGLPAAGQGPPQPEAALPATGEAAAVLKPVDTAVATMVSRHGIPGAALAIAKGGKLVFARGYGWANLATGEQVQPDTRFGVASLSKTITAVAVLKLVEQGKLGLDDKAFQVISNVKAAPGVRPDARLASITVRQLLNHSGGWDHKKSGDPVNWTTQLQLKRGDRKPVSAEALIGYTMGVPLDFDPGTDSKYSNFGYIVLGEVIARASGRSYEEYVKEEVLAPMGVRGIELHPLDGRYFEKEAHRYLAGTDNELPPWQQKYSDAAGGWTASAVDLVKFLTALDGSRGKPILGEKTFREMIAPPPRPLTPRADGTHVGLGWDAVVATDKGFGYFKDGGWYGMRSYMKRLPNGVNWVLLFNASMQPDTLDIQITTDAVKEVRRALEGVTELPDIDLFKKFR